MVSYMVSHDIIDYCAPIDICHVAAMLVNIDSVPLASG